MPGALPTSELNRVIDKLSQFEDRFRRIERLLDVYTPNDITIERAGDGKAKVYSVLSLPTGDAEGDSPMRDPWEPYLDTDATGDDAWNKFKVNTGYVNNISQDNPYESFTAKDEDTYYADIQIMIERGMFVGGITSVQVKSGKLDHSSLVVMDEATKFPVSFKIILGTLSVDNSSKTVRFGIAQNKHIYVNSIPDRYSGTKRYVSLTFQNA